MRSARWRIDVRALDHDTLGDREYFLAGHDWGGPVAFSLALDHPDEVRKLAIQDAPIAGDGASNISQGGQRWHHAFDQTIGLPEQLTEGREEIYLRSFYCATTVVRPDVKNDEEIADHVALYSRPGRMSAGFGYYRALARGHRGQPSTTGGRQAGDPGARSWRGQRLGPGDRGPRIGQPGRAICNGGRRRSLRSLDAGGATG